MPRYQLRILILLFFGAFCLGFFTFFPTYSPDLMASWLAGQFLETGHPEQVYGVAGDYFRMYPPSEWRDFMAREYEYDGPIFPFLYPPLWAKLGQVLSGVNFWRLAAVALAINTGLLLATVWLAWRACRPTVNPVLFMGLAIFFLASNHIGSLALFQNQPQILASFLLVLAAERIRAGSSAVAGAALALAAAIKVYPALLALLWLAGRERRAFAWFLSTGMVLGLISVFWAGWPLHSAFIEQIRLISKSVLVTGVSFNLDAVIGQVFFGDKLIWVPALEGPSPAYPKPGWYSMPRPVFWRIASPVVLLGTLIWLARLFRSAPRDIQVSLLWPLALTSVALVSPITWVYYYIPAACYAPVLLDRLGPRLGGAILFTSFSIIFGPFIRFYRALSEGEDALEIFATIPYIYQILGTFAMMILAFGFWLAAKRAMRAA